jgi:hypothetical protein
VEKVFDPEVEPGSKAMEWARNHGKPFTRKEAFKEMKAAGADISEATMKRHFKKAIANREMYEIFHPVEKKFFLHLADPGSQITAGSSLPPA